MRYRFKLFLFIFLISNTLLSGCNPSLEKEIEKNSSNDEKTVSEKYNSNRDPLDFSTAEIFNMNEKVEVDGWDIVINDYYILNEFEDRLLKSIEDGLFVKVDMDVSRTGSEGVNFLYQLGNIEIKLLLNDKYIYSVDNTLNSNEGNLASTRIEPLDKKTGYIVFKFPEQVKEEKIDTLKLLIRTGDILPMGKIEDVEQTIVNLK